VLSHEAFRLFGCLFQCRQWQDSPAAL
jgi:hypothetical protein